jgi:hypothetical protein
MTLVGLTQQTGAGVMINPGQILYTERERSGPGSRVVLSSRESLRAVDLSLARRWDGMEAPRQGWTRIPFNSRRQKGGRFSRSAIPSALQSPHPVCLPYPWQGPRIITPVPWQRIRRSRIARQEWRAVPPKVAVPPLDYTHRWMRIVSKRRGCGSSSLLSISIRIQTAI